jgi:hypothetical protein
MIRILRSKILLRFGSKALLKKKKKKPEPRERTLTFSKFIEDLGLIDTGVEVLEDIEW